MKKTVGIIIAFALTAIVFCPMVFCASQKESYVNAVKSYSQTETVTVIEDEPVPLSGPEQSHAPAKGAFLMWIAALSVVAFAGDRMLRNAHLVYGEEEHE